MPRAAPRTPEQKFSASVFKRERRGAEKSHRRQSDRVEAALNSSVMTHALPPLTKDRIEAFAASAILWCVWLMGAALKLIAPDKNRRLTRFVERTEREVESILFLRALHRFGPIPRRRCIPRPAPAGFRRRATRGRMRLLFRNSGVRARKASLIARIASLAGALANPGPHIAYFFKRMLRGLRAPALVVAAPPASMLPPPPPGAAFLADSS
jgi:hypothetical protein